jgi:hypothetical protein
MTRSTRPAAKQTSTRRKELPLARLDELIADATVDAYDESEQALGFHSMFQEHLATPFQTEVLGVVVSVEHVEQTDDNRIVAVCVRGRVRQRIPILDLPLPEPPPDGVEWIDAYRRWARGR